MKIRNARIYHCVSCGRVVHSEFEAAPPQCCGQTMARAAAETIREGDVAGEDASGQSETAPPVRTPRRKKTHNCKILHCISCGRVVHAELEAPASQCCGHAMVNAATETIREGDVSGEKAGGNAETAPPLSTGRVKPK